VDPLKATIHVRQKALELGFNLCGFSKAGPLDEEARKLEEWLNQNMHADLGWMENNFEKRIDPTVLVPGAKSVVTVIGSYRVQENEEWDRQADRPKIAKYARGRDYHKVFKEFLQLASLLGFSESELITAYHEKNKVNYERQQTGY